ncbi:MAG: sigma-70 family RNA polymerase sigma factor [Bacteroidota bacterium]
MNITAEHIKQVKQGSSATQKLVFEGLFSTMFRVCQRYIVQTDEAEDCVMKGFLKAFQQIEQFEYRDEGSFQFWLKRIMVNEALMSLRKKTNFNLVSHEVLPEVGFDDDGIQHVDASYLFDAVLKLPPGYRTVLNLFVIEGYSHREIADLLNVSESTSKTQLVKAKSKLKKLITQTNYGYGNS